MFLFGPLATPFIDFLPVFSGHPLMVLYGLHPFRSLFKMMGLPIKLLMSFPVVETCTPSVSCIFTGDCAWAWFSVWFSNWRIFLLSTSNLLSLCSTSLSRTSIRFIRWSSSSTIWGGGSISDCSTMKTSLHFLAPSCVITSSFILRTEFDTLVSVTSLSLLASLYRSFIAASTSSPVNTPLCERKFSTTSLTACSRAAFLSASPFLLSTVRSGPSLSPSLNFWRSSLTISSALRSLQASSILFRSSSNSFAHFSHLHSSSELPSWHSSPSLRPPHPQWYHFWHLRKRYHSSPSYCTFHTFHTSSPASPCSRKILVKLEKNNAPAFRRTWTKTEQAVHQTLFSGGRARKMRSGNETIPWCGLIVSVFVPSMHRTLSNVHSLLTVPPLRLSAVQWFLSQCSLVPRLLPM